MPCVSGFWTIFSLGAPNIYQAAKAYKNIAEYKSSG